MTSTAAPETPLDDDAARLAELGYTQALSRRMSGFENFAISFTIISVLSGCLTLYGTGINNGGPAGIAWGWPLVSIMVTVVALSMAELASAYPTAGGLYWWASRLGGPVWGWFTGWLNLVGQIAVLAGIDYGAATFTTALLGLTFGLGQGVDTILVVYALILVLHAVLNITGVQLVATLNRVSAYWHLGGVALLVVLLAVLPDSHLSVSQVFTTTVNNSGFSHGWFVLTFCLGLLLGQYTFTGYDASAHMSEETRGAATAAARGVVGSVVVSAIAGYALLLAFTFAISDLGVVSDAGGFAAVQVLTDGLSRHVAELALAVCVVAQLFCGMSAVTAASRMMYAFSRDRAVPGHRLWTRLTPAHVPAACVVVICVLAFALAAPSHWNVTAYVAVTSIATIALYLAYVIPIALRLRAGRSFSPGPWQLGRLSRPLGIVAIAWVAFLCVLFVLPTGPAGELWNDGFSWNSVNYAPIALTVVLVAVGLGWQLSARHWFAGPAVAPPPPSSSPAVEPPAVESERVG